MTIRVQGQHESTTRLTDPINPTSPFITKTFSISFVQQKISHPNCVVLSQAIPEDAMMNSTATQAEAEIPSSPKLMYMGRIFDNSSASGNSGDFSDCNSDVSGEFAATSSERRKLLISCTSNDSDELLEHLIAGLGSFSIEEQKQAALEIRLLAKNKPENRLRIAEAGAIKPLIALISSSDLQLQEYGVTAILNLSLCDENKETIASFGAIKPLIRALKSGTPTAKENSACALLRLSQFDEYKIMIGRSGAVGPLVELLEQGTIRGKKDASTALYALCALKENKIRAVQAGIMRPLVELMADLQELNSNSSSMVDKCAYVVSLLMPLKEAREGLVEKGGIPVLVEIIEVGTQQQKEIVVAILLILCENSAMYRTMVAREGAIPPLVALTQAGTTRAKRKAEALIELLRRPRSGNGGGSGASTSMAAKILSA